MIYVGIDLSMRSTGFVAIDDDGNIVCSKIIGGTEPCDTLPQRIAHYCRIAASIRAELFALGNPQKPLAIAIEGYAIFGHAPVSAPEMGGIVRTVLVNYAHLWEIPPLTLKKFVTGVGAGKKELMIKEVFKRWRFDTDSNDLADAYGLARLVRAHFRDDNTLTAGQRETVTSTFAPKVAKPKRKKT